MALEIESDRASVQQTEQKLIRVVGKKEIIALTINAIIGAGIFAIPAVISGILGRASPVAFIGAGLFTILIVLCFAELGGRYDRTGGAYLYASEAFGGVLAFLVGWLYFLARLTSVAALTNALIGFIGYFYEIGTPFRELFVITFISFLGFINYRGIQYSSTLINFLTIAKLAALLVFIIGGLAVMNWGVYKGLTFPPIESFMKALLLCMFVFTGFEVIGIPGGEMKNAKKDVPSGLLIGTFIAIVFYLLIQVVAVAVFPGIAGSQRPLADAAQAMFGHKGGTFLTIGAILSVTGTLLGLMLHGPRILFAMSMQQHMPHSLSRVDPIFRSPSTAIITFAIICIAVTLSSGFANLAALSALARLVTYICSAIALLVLRKRIPSPNTFNIPGGPGVPIITILLSLFLMTAATREQWIAGISALAVGFVLYFLARKALPTSQTASR